MRAAGVNRVVPAVVWLNQTGHRGRTGLSYSGGYGNGAGRGSAGMAQEETKEGEYEVMEWPAPSPLL